MPIPSAPGSTSQYWSVAAERRLSQDRAAAVEGTADVASRHNSTIKNQRLVTTRDTHDRASD
jgi:hypothetical protein